MSDMVIQVELRGGSKAIRFATRELGPGLLPMTEERLRGRLDEIKPHSLIPFLLRMEGSLDRLRAEQLKEVQEKQVTLEGDLKFWNLPPSPAVQEVIAVAPGLQLVRDPEPPAGGTIQSSSKPLLRARMTLYQMTIKSVQWISKGGREAFQVALTAKNVIYTIYPTD